MCEKKLVRAKQLIDGLGGEQSRWTHNVAQLSEDYENVTGNVLMSAGLIAYLGAFTSSYRKGIIQEWAKLCKERKIPCAENPSLLRTLGDPVVIGHGMHKVCQPILFLWTMQLLYLTLDGGP